MELEFRFRNNDLGPVFPTFQERVNSMLPVNRAESTPAAPAAPADDEAGTSAAPVLDQPVPGKPNMINSDEMRQALAQVEQEAVQLSQDLIQVHTGLNEQRVARLLGLLD